MHYVLGEEFERFIALLRVAIEYEQPQSLNLCFIVDENNNKNYEKPAGNGPQNQDNRYCHNIVGFHPTFLNTHFMQSIAFPGSYLVELIAAVQHVSKSISTSSSTT